MHVLITGASGFLGRQTVLQALQQGYQVRAASRSEVAASENHPHLTWVQADFNIASPEEISPLLEEIDVVIHLAAALTGDFETQYASTVRGTEHLLAAMQLMNITKLVLVSSFSVYDYKVIPEGSLLDENSPLESHPEQRDTYTRMKLLQEQLARGFAANGGKVVILRPGMIYGPEHLLNAFVGSPLIGKIRLRIGQNAQLPLSYVQNCASAITKAVSCPEAFGQTFNIVDGHLPDQATYASSIAEKLQQPIFCVVIPWKFMQWLAELTWQLNQRFGEFLKLPGLLMPSRLHARYKPLKYSNDKAEKGLGWLPNNDFQANLDASANSRCD